MKGMNKVFLLGNLGKDPEVNVSKKGVVMSSFSVATNDYVKNERNEYESVPSWHNIKFFGSLAEVANKYLKKGSRVLIEGAINYNDFKKDEKSPKIRYTSIVGRGLTMIGKPQGAGAASDEDLPI